MIYCNENEASAVHWLKCLPLGIDRVDGRGIEDISGSELHEHKQHHFFAGIGGWPLALQLAGWPADVPIWTGSCPCQPYSAAGAGGGNDDPRALWWAWRWLIQQRRPPVVFGEQVASKAGRAWFAGVRADLEALGYAVGAADLCAAGAGAPHIRQRLFWVADAHSNGRSERWKRFAAAWNDGTVGDGSSCGMGDSRRNVRNQGSGYTNGMEAKERGKPIVNTQLTCSDDYRTASVRRGDGFWGRSDYLYCSDGRYRPVEPGTFPLAHGVPGRVAQLRGLGNAIVPQVAEVFIRSFIDAVIN